MTSLRVFIATLALAVNLDNVRADYPWPSPLNIYYKQNGTYCDTIDVNIILNNVPAEANRYVLYYQTENCDKNTIGQLSAARCNEPVRNEPIPTNGMINFIQKLNKRSFRLYIELRIETKFCATKPITDGVSDENAHDCSSLMCWRLYIKALEFTIQERINAFHEACLNKHRNLCNITADFRNQCEEQTRAEMHCTEKKRLTCEVVDEVIPEDTVHQWYQNQIYKNGWNLIGAIPPVKGSKTEFKMTIHKFDKNTYIYGILNSKHWENNLRTKDFKVPLPKNGAKNYVHKHIMKFTENEGVSFNCSNKANTRIGWIEPTGNNIITYDKTAIAFDPFTKNDSNSMLCCLNYDTYTVRNKKVVERTVTDITVLIYEEPVLQDNKVSTSDPPLRTTSRASEELTSPSGTDPNSDSPWNNYYIVIGAVVGIILVTSLTYVVIKKCSRKSFDPEQTLQLETYATASSNMVLYAELDIPPGTGPAPASTEDATYAEIIGVLRPENGHVK